MDSPRSIKNGPGPSVGLFDRYPEALTVLVTLLRPQSVGHLTLQPGPEGTAQAPVLPKLPDGRWMGGGGVMVAANNTAHKYASTSQALVIAGDVADLHRWHS